MFHSIYLVLVVLRCDNVGLFLYLCSVKRFLYGTYFISKNAFCCDNKGRFFCAFVTGLLLANLNGINNNQSINILR